MTPAEEDALVEKMSASLCDWKPQTDLFGICREAIRAAYAQGREDAAKVCEEMDADYWNLRTHDKKVTALKCAAAIRRG